MVAKAKDRALPPFFAKNNVPIPSEREKRILSLTQKEHSLSQRTIMRETGLAQQTVSRLVKGLIETGTLTESEREYHGGRGQPSMSVQLAPGFAYAFGVSMMLDALSVVLVDFAGNVVVEEYADMPSMSRRQVLSTLDEMFEAIIRKSNVDKDRIFGVGVGISGYHMGNGARFDTPRALDDWALVDIEDILSEHLGHPIWAENDGNAAAIGESLIGVGRKYANFAYLYIDVGIGGGIIMDHKLVLGQNGNAGEIGMILPRQIYPHPNLELLRQILARRDRHFESIPEMLRQFDIDWPGVEEWITKSRDSLSVIASALAAILDAEAIVLGGRLPKSLGKKVIPHIEVYDHHRRAEPKPIPRIIMANSPGDVCAIGAATLPFKKYFFPGIV
ncbi:MAG: ROK family transcriptional regulator [Sphingomonadales bacterium]